MAVSTTSVPQATRLRRSHRVAILVVFAAVIGVIAWAVPAYAVDSEARSMNSGAPTGAAGATIVGAHPIGPAPTRQAASATNGQGNPNAVPPILRAATPSELAAIRRQEAREAQAFSYRLPLTARYSGAEMDAYAAVCKAGC